MTFKNALCLDGMPENHDCRCKRRADHPGVHWHKFRDGRYRFWTDDSNESTITSLKVIQGLRKIERKP